MREVSVRAWYPSCGSWLGLSMCRWCHGLCSQPLLAETGSQTHSLTCSFHHKCFSSIWGLQDILQLLVPMEEIPKASPISTVSSACLLQAKSW